MGSLFAVRPFTWVSEAPGASVIPFSPESLSSVLKCLPPLGQSQGHTYRFYDPKSPTSGLLGRRREKGKNVMRCFTLKMTYFTKERNKETTAYSSSHSFTGCLRLRCEWKRGWKLGSGVWAVTGLGQHGAARLIGKAGLDELRAWPSSCLSDHLLGAGLDSALMQRPPQVTITRHNPHARATAGTALRAQALRLPSHVRTFSWEWASCLPGLGGRRAWPCVSGRAVTPRRWRTAGHPQTQTGQGRGWHKAPPPGAGLCASAAGDLE